MRILLVRTDRIGDVVLTLPMLSVLRKRYPDAHLAMLVRKYTSEIVEGNPHLDDILPYDDDQSLIRFHTMLSTLQKNHFDSVIVVHPTLRLALLMWLARVPLRVGTGYRYYSFLFNKRVYEHRKNAQFHELEYNLNLLKQFDCPIDGKPEFPIPIPSSVEEDITDLFGALGITREREVVVIHPGTGGSAREWPAEYFGLLAARLESEREMQVLVTGTKGEERQAAEVVSGTHGKAISLVSKLSLKQLAAVIKRAQLFVSNSTGPLHIAVAVGTPVVSLFPQMVPMSAARWGPYSLKKRVLIPDKPTDCRECEKSSGLPCECMMSIPVDGVYRAAISLLEECKQGELAANG